MNRMTQNMKKVMSVMLAVAMMLTLNLANLTVHAAAAAPAADATTELANADLGIASVSIGNLPGTFYMDDNDEEHMYLRFMFPNNTSESELTNLTVKIDSSVKFTSEAVTITESESPSGEGYKVYTFTADLFNYAPVISYDGVDVIVAAGIEGGSSALAETGQVATATINGTAATMNRLVTANPLPGNIYYNEQNIEWTYVGYYINAKDVSNTPSVEEAVLSYTLIGGGDGKITVDLSRNSATVTINGQNYTIKATFAGVFIATPDNFWIDFREMENGADKTKYAAQFTQAAGIKAGVKAYYENPSTQRQFPEGTTNMQVLQTILGWCAEHGYIDGSKTTLGSSVTYVSRINGLGEFSIGSMSGWMYTDNPYQEETKPENWKTPSIGGADYVLSPDSTIAWFYTINYGTHPW